MFNKLERKMKTNRELNFTKVFYVLRNMKQKGLFFSLNLSSVCLTVAPENKSSYTLLAAITDP